MYSSRPKRKVPVFLNVYDLGNNNQWLHGLGLGAYHSGIEVYGREYSFGHGNNGGSGVFELSPRSADGCIFREQLLLGEINLSISEVTAAIDKLKPQFRAHEYHILQRNCNVFSDTLSNALLGRGIPAWVNRLAGLGQCCSCFLPPEMQTKPKVPGAGGAAGGGAKGNAVTDKLLSGSGTVSSSDSSFVAFSGAGNSLTSADSKHAASSPGSSSSKSATPAAASGGATAAAGGSSAAADEKREKMRRAALDRLLKSKDNKSSA